MTLLILYLIGVALAYPVIFAAFREDSELTSTDFGWEKDWFYKEDVWFSILFSLFSWIGIPIILYKEGFHGFRWK